MQSIQRGAWDHMLDNVVNFYYGYVQVHQKGYWEEQSLNRALAWSDELKSKLLTTPAVRAAAPRLESFALASTGEETMGVLVVGTDPAAENALTGLEGRLVAGQYWDGPTDGGVLLASGVAEKLALVPGDTLILLSQGYRGANAAGKYPVRGLLKFGSPELNKQMVYLTQEQAAYFFAAENLATTVALKLDRKEDVGRVMQALRQQLDTSQYEIMSWQEMIPELVEAKELDTAGNNLVLAVLYLIISFGVFGTILMMVRERQYEFGVLIGIGMQRFQLGLTVWLEIIFLGLLGVLAGMALSFPLVYYFQQSPIDLSMMGEEAVATYEKFGMEPILPAAVDFDIFFQQAVIVFFITTLLAIYPYLKLRKLDPVSAMRGA
ncbi:MAG: ABC transporter permease [Bacteroidetes bacterium]|nr:MAG: ABC transporter permease [Bacteroidota bacterium]